MDRKIVALALAFSLVGAALAYQAFLREEEDDYPEIREEFRVQGLISRTIAYYYFPGIYDSIYDHESNLRLVSKARHAGANYLLVRAFYNCTEEGDLVGDDAEAEGRLGDAIATAHEHGLKVFLTPFVESMEFWPVSRWELSADTWTEKVLRWARFAEENGVELFAPGFEMAIILDEEESVGWFRGILPRIREVYGGEVAFAEIPYGEQWEHLDGSRVFEGYDCAGITVFPWKDYDGVHDLRSLEDLKEHVEEQATRLDEIGERYDIEFRFVATLGMDYWLGEMPDARMRSRGYEAALDVLREHDIDGVFLHLWASEHDHLGEDKDVEDMFEERWTR